MKGADQQPLARARYDAPETQPLGTGGDMHFAYSYSARAAEGRSKSSSPVKYLF